MKTLRKFRNKSHKDMQGPYGEYYKILLRDC